MNDWCECEKPRIKFVEGSCKGCGLFPNPAPMSTQLKPPNINYGRKVEVEELKLLTPEQSAKQFAEMFGHCNPEPNAREWYLKTESEKFGEGPNPFREGYPSEVIPYIMDTTYAMPKRSTPQDVHVIEHSAYQKLERELAEWKDMWNGDIDAALEALKLLGKEREKVAGLSEALKSYLAFEDKNIAKDGPYVSKEINVQITQMREALKRFGESK